jgi:hypothetical protein
VSALKGPKNHDHLPDQRLGQLLGDRDRQLESKRGKLNKIGTIVLVVIIGGSAALFFSSAENRAAVATFKKLMDEAQTPAPPPPTAPPSAPGAAPALKPNGLIDPADARFAKEIFQFIQAPNEKK